MFFETSFAAALLFVGAAQAVETPKIAALCIAGSICIVLSMILMPP